MRPRAETITPIARPWANATSNRSLPATMMAPAPMKTSVNVPIDSAMALLTVEMDNSRLRRGVSTRPIRRFPAARLASRDLSRDVRGASAVEAADEFEMEFRGLPRCVREDEVREEPRRIRGNLGDQVVRAEQRLEDPLRLFAAGSLVDEAERVKVFVQQDIERVRFVQALVRLLDPEERHLVHHDHVTRDRVKRPEESLRVVSQIREREHEARTRPSEDRLDGSFHEFEEVRRVPSLLKFRREIHRQLEASVTLKELPAGIASASSLYLTSS